MGAGGTISDRDRFSVPGPGAVPGRTQRAGTRAPGRGSAWGSARRHGGRNRRAHDRELPRAVCAVKPSLCREPVSVVSFKRVQNTPSSLDLAQIFEPIRADLEAVEREFLRHVESRVELIPQIGRYIQTSGGKRVRPALLLMAARLAGYTGDRAVLYASVVE